MFAFALSLSLVWCTDFRIKVYVCWCGGLTPACLSCLGEKQKKNINRRNVVQSVMAE